MPSEISKSVNTPMKQEEFGLQPTEKNEEILTVTRKDGAVQARVNFPTANIAVLGGEGPVDLTFNCTLNIDAREQHLHDQRVVSNTDINTTLANGDSVINTLAGALSKLFNF